MEEHGERISLLTGAWILILLPALLIQCLHLQLYM